MTSLPHTTQHTPQPPPPNLPPQPQPSNPILHPPYYVDPTQVYLLPPSPPAPPPRPRKPYTSTKVREMWTSEEHERMLEALRLYKRDWTKVTKYVGTRSAAQVRSHAQKYFDRVARDKTDDYVPRARPKRKSATPYPRKARVDSPQLSHPPIPVPSQSPILNPSPVLSHPPLTVPYQHVYSPYVVDRPLSSPHQSSTLPAVPSPLSYVAGYPSPVSHVVPPHHMYGMFSPITPSFPPQGPPPAVSHGPGPAVSSASLQPAHPHIPTHSHPGGPMDNCAKCIALRRYGNVFQELGDFHHPSAPQPLPHTAIPPNATASHLRCPHHAVHQLPMPSPQQTGEPRIQGSGHVAEAKVEVVEEKSTKCPAEYRAHRAMVMKARKAKSKGRSLPKTVQSSGSEPSSSESFSATISKDPNCDEAPVKRMGSENQILTVSKMKKRKNRSAGERPTKRRRQMGEGARKGGRIRSEEVIPSAAEGIESARMATADSSPMTVIGEEKSEESAAKGRRSPVVDNYSQKEQKEIYDAVKSLQILAKTSSLSSNESKGKRVGG